MTVRLTHARPTRLTAADGHQPEAIDATTHEMIVDTVHVHETVKFESEREVGLETVATETTGIKTVMGAERGTAKEVLAETVVPTGEVGLETNPTDGTGLR